MTEDDLKFMAEAAFLMSSFRNSPDKKWLWMRGWIAAYKSTNPNKALPKNNKNKKDWST
jgi:hypothetical protein